MISPNQAIDNEALSKAKVALKLEMGSPDTSRSESANISLALLEVLEEFGSQDQRYQIEPGEDGWIGLKPKKEFIQELLSDGLKIHATIPYTHPEYLEVVREILRICSCNDVDGHPTQFKIMSPTVLSKMKPDDIQSAKSITIYPHLLNGGETNTPETIRLVAELRKIMKNVLYVPNPGESILSLSEHQSGQYIYLRPGALTEFGDEKVLKTESFFTQLANLDGSPGHDPLLARREIMQAIQNGQL